MRLILASASPRRQELLAELGLPFEVCPSEVDETLDSTLSPEVQVEQLALQKAQAVAESCGLDCLVLGSDTVVVVGREILGKPQDEADADRMLKKLSGGWHEVITGVAFVSTGIDSRIALTHERTRVLFKNLSDTDRQRYIASKEPMDKAGAYAIQGLGARFIETYEGDYTNVVGLPMALVTEKIREMIKETPK